MYVCDDCRDASTVDTFLSETGFTQIAESFRRSGKAVPVRKFIRLEWKLVEDNEHAFTGTPFGDPALRPKEKK